MLVGVNKYWFPLHAAALSGQVLNERTWVFRLGGSAFPCPSTTLESIDLGGCLLTRLIRIRYLISINYCVMGRTPNQAPEDLWRVSSIGLLAESNELMSLKVPYKLSNSV